LLNVLKVVARVTIQDHLANGSEWVVLVRPDLGIVKDVVPYCFGVLGVHDLNAKGPGWEVTLHDSIVQVTDMVVGILASEACRLRGVQCLNTCVRFEVPFDVFERAVFRFAKLVCMDAEAAKSRQYINRVEGNSGMLT